MKSLGSLKLQPYDEHEINKCEQREQRFVCCICIEICFTIEKLKVHYINVHGYQHKPSAENEFNSLKGTSDADRPSENKTSYYSSKICSICSISFKNQKTLSKHVKTVHNKLKSFICSVCSKMFSRKATLDIHLKQHLSDESAKICCPSSQCNFKAADPSVMAKHKKLHDKTNDGKYKCPSEHCSYYAIQATGLKKHMISKHHDLFAATMKCTFSACEFVSVNPERLRKHINFHEKGLLDKKEESRDVMVKESAKANLNSSMEISSDCFLPIESTDSLVNHSVDTGGVTIIHIHNTSSNVHSEDTVF